MDIQLVDLKAQYKILENELDYITKEVLCSTNYIMGKYVANFEEEFAKYIGVKHAI